MRCSAARLRRSFLESSSRMVSASPLVPPRPKARGLVVRNETTAERLARAKGYPYARPDTSFILCNGKAYTFPNSAWVPPSQWHGSLEPLLQLQVTAADAADDTPSSASSTANGDVLSTSSVTRSLQEVLQQHGVKDSALTADTLLTAILAIGSNAGPEQLARKFPVDLFPDGVVVPVVQCVLHDFDVVYAPLISSYGSATATLEHSPGTAVSVYVTYLTPPLQQRMHETEGAYNLCRLDDITLLEGLSLQHHMEGVQPVQVQHTAYNYNHQHGTLHVPFSNPGSSPVALAEIAAAGRSFPALSQEQMQAALRAALEGVTERLPGSAAAAGLNTVPSVAHAKPGEAQLSSEGLDDWILTNLEQSSLRRARVSALTQAAVPFQYERSEVLMVIGTALSTSVK